MFNKLDKSIFSKDKYDKERWELAKELAKDVIDELRRDIANGKIQDPRLVNLLKDIDLGKALN